MRRGLPSRQPSTGLNRRADQYSNANRPWILSTSGATPLGAAYIYTRQDWHRHLEHHLGELLAYLERNQGALVQYAPGAGMAA